MLTKRLGLAAMVIAIAAVAFFYWRSPSSANGTAMQTANKPNLLNSPKRPSRPPMGAKRERTPHPQKPRLSPEFLKQKYREAAESGAKRPGAAAFRATTDAFYEHNIEFAKAQADKEGLTLGEVKELTYVGYLIMQSQQMGEVERVLGRKLKEEEKHLLDDLRHNTNNDFKKTMREMVNNGADVTAREAYIAKTQAQFMKEYYAISGMSEGQFDELLAGDAARTYAPISTPPPEELPKPRPYVESKPRPAGPPK